MIKFHETQYNFIGLELGKREVKDIHTNYKQIKFHLKKVGVSLVCKERKQKIKKTISVVSLSPFVRRTQHHYQIEENEILYKIAVI